MWQSQYLLKIKFQNPRQVSLRNNQQAGELHLHSAQPTACRRPIPRIQKAVHRGCTRCRGFRTAAATDKRWSMLWCPAPSSILMALCMRFVRLHFLYLLWFCGKLELLCPASSCAEQGQQRQHSQLARHRRPVQQSLLGSISFSTLCAKIFQEVRDRAARSNVIVTIRSASEVKQTNRQKR